MTSAQMSRSPTALRRPFLLPLLAGLAFAAVPPPALDLSLGSAWARGADRGGSDRGGSERGGSDRGSSDRGGSDRGGSERGGERSGGVGGSSYGSTGTSSVSGDFSPGEASGRGRGAGGLFGSGGLFGGDPETARSRVEEVARERYSAALGIAGNEKGGRNRLGTSTYTLDDSLTASLVSRGWQADGDLDGSGFRNHGERVSSLVEIAKALGYGAHVGALQANFGGVPDGETASDSADAERTAIDDELATLRDELAALTDPLDEAALAIEERIAGLQAELDALEDMPADAIGWDGDWRTANLDINGDGKIDTADLELAQAIEPTPSNDEADEAAVQEPEAPLAEEIGAVTEPAT